MADDLIDDIAPVNSLGVPIKRMRVRRLPYGYRCEGNRDSQAY